MRRIALIAFALALLAPSVAIAVQPDEILKDPTLEARARTLSRELRCMVCQNQSIDDSEAPLARDLRRHYGERYRIVRAESGPDALATLKELKLRGETAAVLVADYRMPQMSGIEFLERPWTCFRWPAGCF